MVSRVRGDEKFKKQAAVYIFCCLLTPPYLRGWRASLCCWKVVTTAGSAPSLLWENICGLACVSRVHHGVHMACVWRSCNMYPRLGLVQAGSQGYLKMGTNRLSTAGAGIDLQIERPSRTSPKHGEVVHFSALELMPKRRVNRYNGSLKRHARTHEHGFENSN